MFLRFVQEIKLMLSCLFNEMCNLGIFFYLQGYYDRQIGQFITLNSVRITLDRDRHKALAI